MPRHPPPLHLALNTTSIYVVNETTPNAADLVYARVKQRILPVSYTHLTLPTNREV